MRGAIDEWLARIELDADLRGHVGDVLATMPGGVVAGLIGDPSFTLCDYEPIPGAMLLVPVGPPRPSAGGRSVVLKRTLRRRPVPFIRYVIAHELAHAHLRNAGRWPGDDPERAADALAAKWGHPRPG